MGTNLDEKILWALSDEAQTLLNELKGQGYDLDLAIACISTIWPEEKIFNLTDVVVSNERP